MGVRRSENQTRKGSAGTWGTLGSPHQGRWATPERGTRGGPPRALPLSWGRGCSSAWLPWLRNCDEPCERFCLCALRTDFRVKPSTFSEAEMAAQATGAGGDGDDISATPAAPGTSRRGWPGKWARDGRAEPAPLRPGLRPRRPRAPRAAPRPTAPHGRIPAPRGRLPGLAEGRAGARGPLKLLTPGAEGGRRRARSLDGWGERARLASPECTEPRRLLSGRCPRRPPGREPPPGALPSRVRASRRRALASPVNADPSSPGAATGAPTPAASPSLSPARPPTAHGARRASDCYNLRGRLVRATGARAGRGARGACVRARAARGRARGGWREEFD